MGESLESGGIATRNLGSPPFMYDQAPIRHSLGLLQELFLFGLQPATPLNSAASSILGIHTAD